MSSNFSSFVTDVATKKGFFVQAMFLIIIEQVAWNKSSSLLTIIFKMHTHYNYLQSKLFTKVIFKMPNKLVLREGRSARA
jgi:hypothetical protein